MSGALSKERNEGRVYYLVRKIANIIFLHSIKNQDELEKLERELMKLLEEYARELSGKSFDQEFYNHLIEILEKEEATLDDGTKIKFPKHHWDIIFWATRCCFNRNYQYRDVNGDLLVIPEGNLSVETKMSILRASQPDISSMACFANYKNNVERRPGEKPFDDYEYFMELVRMFFPLAVDKYGCAKEIIG